MRIAIAVAAALAAAVAVFQTVGRPDSTGSATPAEAATHAAETANRSDADGVVARGAADSRLAHAPFVAAPSEPAIEPDGFPRPEPPPDARRIVVPAMTLTLTVRDQQNRPVVGRPFALAVGGGFPFRRRTTEEDGRIRWRRSSSGPIVVHDLGRVERAMTRGGGIRRVMKRYERLGRYRFVSDSAAFHVAGARIDGVPATVSEDQFAARFPSDVDVRMRSLPLAFVRVVDADGHPVPNAGVRVDASFHGSPFWVALDRGVTDVDGAAYVEVPCDGRTLAVDAPLRSLRWRIASPGPREEATVEVPLAASSTSVDAGTVALTSLRLWRVRVFDGKGSERYGCDVKSIAAAGAAISEEGGLKELDRLFADADDYPTLLYARPGDTHLRVRLPERPDEVCDVLIDRDASAVDGPGQRIDCTSWNRLPGEASPDREVISVSIPEVLEPVVLRVRLETATGAPLPRVRLSCSNDAHGDLHETNEDGTAEIYVHHGAGAVGVDASDPAHALIPWSIAYDARSPETSVLLRARPLRDVVVRTLPERSEAPWDPDAVVTRVFTEGAPPIACERAERVRSSEPRGVAEDRFVAPDDEEVVVEHRYMGVTRLVRLPPKARTAEFDLGPACPVRWTAPHLPAAIEFAVAFAPPFGGVPAYEADGELHPGNGARASGELRLPPGRYRALLRVVVPGAADAPFVVDYERIVDVTPDFPAVVEFGP